MENDYTGVLAWGLALVANVGGILLWLYEMTKKK